jgi:membrane protease YdiL (CAAX protease family)
MAAASSVMALALLASSGRLAFLLREFSGARRRIAAVILLGLALFFVVFLPAAGGGRVSETEPDDLSFPALFLGHGLLLLFLVAWRGLRPLPLATGSRLLRLDHLLADVRYGVWIGVAGWLVTIAGTMVVAAIALAAGLGPTVPQEIPAMIVWMANLGIQEKLVIIAVAMTVEELFFRGFLQTRFGLVLSSLFFTLAHASYGLPFMMISVLIISLVIGWALRRTGRLLPCVVAHGVFDAVQLLFILPWAVRLAAGES